MSSTLNSHSLPDIMHYESDIWAIANLLLSASIKQSDFPAYMMPFFALVMLEGRMLNEVSKVELEREPDRSIGSGRVQASLFGMRMRI